MKERKEKDQREKYVINSSKRARLDALLFNGATPAKAFFAPKIPPLQGE